MPQDILPGASPPQFTPVQFVHRRHPDTDSVTRRAIHSASGLDQPEDPAQWKRFGAEFNMPLRSIVIDSKEIRNQRGFFEVSDPGVQRLAFKEAEFLPGWYVLRLQENGGRTVNAVKLASPLLSASLSPCGPTPWNGRPRKRSICQTFHCARGKTLTVLVRL